jgi:hypothetical protein
MRLSRSGWLLRVRLHGERLGYRDTEFAQTREVLESNPSVSVVEYLQRLQPAGLGWAEPVAWRALALSVGLPLPAGMRAEVVPWRAKAVAVCRVEPVVRRTLALRVVLPLLAVQRDRVLVEVVPRRAVSAAAWWAELAVRRTLACPVELPLIAVRRKREMAEAVLQQVEAVVACWAEPVVQQARWMMPSKESPDDHRTRLRYWMSPLGRTSGMRTNLLRVAPAARSGA